MPDSEEPTRGTAIRLIFEYEGDQIRLISQQRVDVAIPGHKLPQEAQEGKFVEVRNAARDPISRVRIADSLGASAEVFPEQPGEPITRVDVERPKGAFTVVVPAPEEAREVAVVQLTPPPPGVLRVSAGTTSPHAGEPESRELAAFPLEAE